MSEEYAQAYIDDTGVIVIEADGQKIEVSDETARKLTIRLCRLFGWGIRPAEGINIGFRGKANGSSTKEKPLGE